MDLLYNISMINLGETYKKAKINLMNYLLNNVDNDVLI